MILEFCDAKNSCITNTWLSKADKKKITYDSGCNKSERFLCIWKSRSQVFFTDIKVITGELQHDLVAVGVDKKTTKENRVDV